MEPQAKFSLITRNKKDHFSFFEKDAPAMRCSYNENYVELVNGEKADMLVFERERALSPGFPYVLEITMKEGNKLEIINICHAKEDNLFKPIPIESIR